MGEVELFHDRALERSWPMSATDNEAGEDRGELYRESAETLRRLAAKIRFDFNRQQQLLRLAEAFDRFAEKLERRAASP